MLTLFCVKVLVFIETSIEGKQSAAHTPESAPLKSVDTTSDSSSPNTQCIPSVSTEESQSETLPKPLNNLLDLLRSVSLTILV